MPKPSEAATNSQNTTELHVDSGMHIESQDGVIARSPINPDTENSTSAPEPFDPRKDIMASIVANRAKTFEKELEYGTGLTNQETIIDEDEAAAAKDAQVATTDQATADALAAAQGKENNASPTNTETSAQTTTPSKKSIIVNGQTLEFTEDELVKLAQRGLAADQRFQEAAQMRAQYQQALQNAQGAQQNAQPTIPAAGQASPVVDEAIAREISRRITFGSEEEQTKAISELIDVAARTAGRATQAPPPEQLVNIATQQALATIRFENNMETIGREFKEIFEDRGLTLIAADAVNALRKKYEMLGTPKSDLDIYREAGTFVKDRYVKPSSAQAQSPSTNATIQSAQAAPMTAKLERKRVAPQPPAAANKIASEAPQQVAPTGSQIVAQMRKARHQSAY